MLDFRKRYFIEFVGENTLLDKDCKTENKVQKNYFTDVNKNKITFRGHCRRLESIIKYVNFQSFAFRWVVSTRRHYVKQQSVLKKKGNYVTTITHGYQDEMFFDRVPVNLGSLLSLKERAPSAPSSEFADNFIARESKR